MEIYKTIKDFETYEVSNYGNVRRTLGTRSFILKPFNTSNGYLRIELGNRLSRPRIHRLVAEYFVPNPHGYKYVNHIDGNKLNNRDSNLEWVTASYNQLHSTYILNNDNILTGGTLAKRSVDMYTPDGKYLRTFDSVDSATSYAGVWIKGALSGRNKTAGGYIWKYTVE